MNSPVRERNKGIRRLDLLSKDAWNRASLQKVILRMGSSRKGGRIRGISISCPWQGVAFSVACSSSTCPPTCPPKLFERRWKLYAKEGASVVKYYFLSSLQIFRHTSLFMFFMEFLTRWNYFPTTNSPYYNNFYVSNRKKVSFLFPLDQDFWNSVEIRIKLDELEERQGEPRMNADGRW